MFLNEVSSMRDCSAFLNTGPGSESKFDAITDMIFKPNTGMLSFHHRILGGISNRDVSWEHMVNMMGSTCS